MSDKVASFSSIYNNGVLTHKMCCICFALIPIEDLFVDKDDIRWDICKPCAEKEEMND